MNPPPAPQKQVKASRTKHNSNHRKRRRKAATTSKDGNIITPRSAERDSATPTATTSGATSKRSPDRHARPVAASGCVEGVAKKKTSRGRPNRPWKPWSKLSLNDIENIAERRGNSGRGFEQSVMLPSKRTQKRKGIDLLSFCPQPPKLTTRAIMEAHAPAIDDVSADADVLRLERENSSLLDDQVARETMLALLEPGHVESVPAAATEHRVESDFDRAAFQRQACYDEFGNDELDTLRQTVAELRQQVVTLQSELQKHRRSKSAKQ